jgi:hypothetical protein
MRLSVAPPSIKTWYNLMLAMVGETSSGSCPTPTMLFGQLEASNLVRVSTHLWCGAAFGVGVAAAISWCKVFMMWSDVPKTSEHDVECFVAFIVTGLRVRVAIDGFQCPPGIPELYLYILLLLRVDSLFALSLAARRAILDVVGGELL